jgi:hypothetical protein
MNLQEQQNELVKKILNGENVREYTEKLYIVMLPLFRMMVRKYG